VFKVSEVYEKQIRRKTENYDGSKLTDFQKIYDARDILINLNYIVSVLPHEFTTSIDKEKLEGNFPENTKFSKLIMDGNSFRKSEIVVVGSFDKLCSLLEDKKT